MLSAMIRPPLLLLLLLAVAQGPVSAGELPEISANPVAHGAWLYRAHCGRCHGDYGKERPGEDYRTADALEKAVAENGCRIDWARSVGGSLSPGEIAAVSRYMRTWEERGREPELPPLPEMPPAPASSPSSPPVPAAAVAAVAGKEEDAALTPPLLQLVQTNPVARGAWLFTGNCYRCHLSYATARMGRGLKGEILRKTVENGKTSTQMRGFGVLAGGKLKNSDIAAIVAYIEAWENLGAPVAIAPELLKPPSLNPADLRPIGLPRFKAVAGDAAKGREIYLLNCSRCHGHDRAGHIGRRLTPPWQSPRPDLFVKSTIKNGIPGSLMPSFSANAGSGPASANLSPRQIDNIVAFLLTGTIPPPSSLSASARDIR